ncbi:hypothetical protein MPTK2_3g11440 [Marchantia polymorpha subsp. ruderalis]
MLNRPSRMYPSRVLTCLSVNRDQLRAFLFHSLTPAPYFCMVLAQFFTFSSVCTSDIYSVALADILSPQTEYIPPFLFAACSISWLETVRATLSGSHLFLSCPHTWILHIIRCRYPQLCSTMA